MSVVDPYQIKVRYGETLVEQTDCVAEGDRLRLKTPLLLPDGRNIQVYIRTGPDWTVVVSDGGFATEQLTVFSSFEDELRARHAKLVELAHQFGLDYSNGELKFMANDLDEALRRISTLARAVLSVMCMLVGN